MSGEGVISGKGGGGGGRGKGEKRAKKNYVKILEEVHVVDGVSEGFSSLRERKIR